MDYYPNHRLFWCNPALLRAGKICLQTIEKKEVRHSSGSCVNSLRTTNFFYRNAVKDDCYCVFAWDFSYCSCRMVKNAPLMGLVLGIFFLAGLAILDPGLFFDRGLYAGALPLVAFLVRDRGASALKTESTLRTGPAQQSFAEDKIVIKSSSMQKLIPFRQVVAIHGAGNYSEIEFESGEKTLDDRGLNFFSTKLPSSFFQVHRSHIVNLEYVTAMHSLGSGKHQLELKDRTVLPVSRSKIKELKDLINPS